MGWSCRAEAGNTMHRIFAIREEKVGTGQGVQGTWKDNGSYCFLEPSNVEHHDGAITGSVYQVRANGLAHRVASFRIEPDGTLSKAPASLRRALERH